MDSIFSIGIQSLWDELSHMPVGGVWWINTDRNEDAISLVNQTIAARIRIPAWLSLAWAKIEENYHAGKRSRPSDGAIIFHDIGSR